MMYQFKNRIFLGICLVSVLGFSQQKKWTLQECVNYALENNITVSQNENTILLNEQDLLEAKGQFLPSVNGNIRHNLSIGNRELFPGQFVDRTDNSTSIGVSANQTIFNGFRLTNLYKQSQLNLETSKLELNRIKDDISLNVVNTYLNVLFNRERLETAKAQYEFSKKQVDQVKELVDAGTQPQVNIYDAEATFSTDEQNLTIAENNFNLSLLTLSQLLQLPFENFDIEIVEINSPSEALLYNNVNPIIDYAFENRVEIKVAEKRIENAELGTEISKSGYYPSLTFNYGFGSNAFFTNVLDNEQDLLAQLDNQKAHAFTLNLGIPIFSRYQNKTAVARARIQEENSKLGLERTKVDLESNIQRAYTDAQAAFKAFVAAEKSMKSQNLAFENAQNRYSIGVMNAFELEQSRVRFINAESALINAKYDFVFKTKVLDFYMGKPLTN
ncbi:outer membrane protein [Hyunsoonleella jejuensis]|uniref:Outer membrane protein n=1 Tax=Hyunsoonleella jejuensis TaxID=419940 RepID=A0A1H9AAT1_9FLAO|nr:TolC family protein [Hyunsoonleella jejuensis]SEP73597.1 outer membrane protein [Hyunsoonleella jejuensis]